MTYLDILEKWAIYSEYDSEQTSFNLLSTNYSLHRVGKVIERILSDYDSTGMLAVIYAKMQFEHLLKATQINLFDVLTNPEVYESEKTLYNMFNAPIVTTAENEFIGKLNDIYIKIVSGKLIGEDEGQRKQLLSSMENVVESIHTCNVDLFMRGGAIGEVKNVSTKLHIFNTLAECLLNIEKSEDGIYFCFISAGNSAECFFSFFLKSNGTIISINDRIDESYIGQHGNCRNARWTDGKVSKIFPYDYIFNYSEHDYKGYATKYELDENKLDLYNLGIEAFMPVVISMLLIILKYRGKDLSEVPLHYLDSFLPENQLKIESNELMVVGDSSLVCSHNSVDLSFDNSKILSGEYSKEFEPKKDKSYKETKHFSNCNQLMVDLWSEGFVFDPSCVLSKNNNIACLIDKDSETYIPEFIGTEQRMRLQVYKEARLQLANYMNDKIYEAWVEFGETEAIRKWYKAALLDNKEFLYQFFSDHEDAIVSGEKKPVSNGWLSTKEITVYFDQNKSAPEYHIRRDEIVNVKEKEGSWWEFICDENGCLCNTWFTVRPQTYEDIEYLTGVKVPKILKGWMLDGHRGGNHILDVTDAVETVKTPFEYRNNDRGDKYYEAYCDFTFAFGFSKSGWNKIKKRLNQK